MSVTRVDTPAIGERIHASRRGFTPPSQLRVQREFDGALRLVISDGG